MIKNWRKEFFNYEKVTKYNIEHVLPSKIMGWVSSKDIKFDEVKFLLGNNIISRAKIDIRREDVFKKYGFDKISGFVLHLPNNIPLFDYDLKAKIIAFSSVHKVNFELKIEKNKTKNFTSEFLKSLIKSDLLGLNGFFDGIDDENKILSGWISTSKLISPKIWLNFYEKIPIQISCNKKFYEIDKFHNYIFYFNYEINKIPFEYEGNIWFSFDEEGKYKIPQNTAVKISKINHTNIKLNKKKITFDYESKKILNIKPHNEQPFVLAIIPQLELAPYVYAVLNSENILFSRKILLILDRSNYIRNSTNQNLFFFSNLSDIYTYNVDSPNDKENFKKFLNFLKLNSISIDHLVVHNFAQNLTRLIAEHLCKSKYLENENHPILNKNAKISIFSDGSRNNLFPEISSQKSFTVFEKLKKDIKILI